MPTKVANKIIYGGQTLIDLTSDTVLEQYLLYGYTAHAADGTTITGSCTYDSDTTDATANTANILSGKTAYVNKNKITGSMTNQGSKTLTITTKAQSVTIPSGYHDGSGHAQIDATEQAKIIAENIKAGVVILGVTGAYGGEEIHAQAKTATPSTNQQVILPDTGYDYLSQVTVNAIPYTEVENPQGGLTITIG